MSFNIRPLGSMKLTSPKWLIRDVIEEDSFIGVFGPTGSYKTFFTMKMALCVAAGIPFEGRKVAQGPVVLVVGEGQGGIMRRATAWSIFYNIDLKAIPAFISVKPAALVDDKNIVELAEAINEITEEHGNPKIIIFDTLARNFGGGDENSTADMGKAITSADYLRNRFSCSVMFSHHSGHAESRRARGSSAFKAALDTEFRLEKQEGTNLVIVENTKTKDAVPLEPETYELLQVLLGVYDDEGREIDSAVLRKTDREIEAKPVTGKWQKLGLETLKAEIKRHRKNLSDAGHDPETHRVSVDAWKDACYAAKMPRQRFSEVKQSLTDFGEVVIYNGTVTLSAGCPSGGTMYPPGQDGQTNRTKPDGNRTETGQRPDKQQKEKNQPPELEIF